MRSKQVRDDGKDADGLVEALRTNAREVASKRAEQLRGAGLKGAPTADALEALYLAEAGLLVSRSAALREADEALAAELGDDLAVFEERDRAAAAVRERLVEFRAVVAANCGDAALAATGFVGNTPRDPVALEDLGRAVVARVADKPPKATKKGVRFDARAALEGLDEEVTALAKANADVRREKREEQSARARRDQAWALFDQEYATTLGTFGATLRAVGLGDLAARLVRSTRAAAAPDTEPSPTPTPTPTPTS